MSVAGLARPEIATLRPYRTAEQQPDTVRLNANEAPAPIAAAATGLNRYPAIRPGVLEARLAALFEVDTTSLLATRGSSEAIDLLLRTFCRAYVDTIVTTPPTFSMYRVYADMQSAGVIEVPLSADNGFAPDVEQILARCETTTKLIFLCSPNNPTGNLVAPADLERLLRDRRDRSLIVVDEAYMEFSGVPSAAAWLRRFDNLVVLRTLSKAYALAGARCGAIIAAPAVINLVAPMLPPYAFSAPTTASILETLSGHGVAAARDMVATTMRERERVSATLRSLDCVAHVWPSSANFLLVRFADPETAAQRLAKARVLVRTYDDKPALRDCARITIGKPAENDLLLDSLAADGGVQA